MKKKWFTLLTGMGFLAGSIGTAFADESSETMSVIAADAMQWKDYPGLPGVKFVVLAGDPGKPGLYVIRARFAPHTMSKPHWHPEARYVTVVSGTWWAGEGDSHDPEQTVPIAAGGFAIHAPAKVHYDGAKDEEVVVQIVGIGPSGTNVVESAKAAK